MKIKEYLNSDISDIMRMGEKQLRKTVQQLVDAANKRIKRYVNNKEGIKAQAIEKAIQEGGFTTKGKNLNELRNEYKRLKNFFDAKTGSLTGAKKYIKELEKRLGVEHGEIDLKKLWELYDEVKDKYASKLERYGSERMQQFLKELPTFDFNKVKKRIEEELQNDYESKAEYERQILQQSETGFFINRNKR